MDRQTDKVYIDGSQTKSAPEGNNFLFLVFSSVHMTIKYPNVQFIFISLVDGRKQSTMADKQKRMPGDNWATEFPSLNIQHRTLILVEGYITHLASRLNSGRKLQQISTFNC